MQVWIRVEDDGRVSTSGVEFAPYGNKPLRYVSHFLNEGFGGRDLFLIVKVPGGQHWSRIGESEYSPAEFYIFRYLGNVRDSGVMLYETFHDFPVQGYKGPEYADKLNGFLNQQKREIVTRLAEEEAS